MSTHTEIIDACFMASPNIRYVAVYMNNVLELRSRADIQLMGSNESDRYEELIVNPTLLKMLAQRGNIDCGGFKYALVRYGTFFAFIYPVPNGHVTVSLELTSYLNAETEKISAVIDTMTAHV